MVVGKGELEPAGEGPRGGRGKLACLLTLLPGFSNAFKKGKKGGK